MRGQISDTVTSFVEFTLLVILLSALAWHTTSYILRIIEERAVPFSYTVTQERAYGSPQTITRVLTVTRTLGEAGKTVTTTLVLTRTEMRTVTESRCGNLTIVITRPITRVPFTLVISG